MIQKLTGQGQGSDARTRKKLLAVTLSIGTAFFLTVFKLSVGFFTHSLGLIASAVDSLMDVLVSTVNYIAIREADKPADKEHLYGHGKIESLAGLFQSLVISASGVFLVAESIRRLITGSHISHISVAVGVMFVSMVLTFFLVLKLKQVLKETGSIIVGTEALHFTVDFLTNGGVILALALVYVTGSGIWDLIVAFLIACYILYQSFGILKKSIDELLDRALPQEEQREIERIILSHDPRIVGFHNLRTRKIGAQRFIDFHFEIRGEENFARAHELTESLIKHIRGRFPGADVTVHFDPEGGE
ncbi:MAG TPA: cation diffusion facilitator family transporter [Candidatus Omnitrophota bacterium]|nr:cation diffusion facilitator family transporter [Candidatus Omnitrophota bacterium]